MTDKPVDLNSRRWEQNTDANDHKPIEAVRAMLRKLESGETDINHVIVIYAVNSDGNGSGYMQAGDLDYFGQIGLLARAQYLMNDA